jgi:hypothetical protein
MKTIIYIEHDVNTDETVCRFADEYSDLSRQQQLAIAEAAKARMESLIEGLEAIIARSSAGTP